MTTETAAPDDEAAEPDVIYTAYFSTVQELTEALAAADTLGLGVRVESYIVHAEDDPDVQHTEFKFTLLSDTPEHREED